MTTVEAGAALTITKLSGGDQTGWLYHIVRHTGSNKVTLADGTATGSGFDVGPAGILQTIATAANRPCAVAIGGVARCHAGGTILEGALLSASASGRAVAAASGDIVIARAQEAASAGDVIRVRVLGAFRMVGAA